MFMSDLSVKLINSAFGPLLKPNVCVLLDVGTKPTGTSIYEVSFSYLSSEIS
jgi:hypothetical protein